MDPLAEYKESVQDRLEKADLAVQGVLNENVKLMRQLELKQQEIESLKEQLQSDKTKISQLEDSKADAEEQSEIMKDLFEQLCGVRIHKTYEDDLGLWFDTSQGNKNGIMDYKLGFVKGKDDETEIVYVPLLKQRSVQELKQLQDQLPEYMFETLSFPLKSLNQFYNKLSKGLSKSV
ncbi:Csm1p [Kluyveromyces lactis]|uniref:KLLA0F10241p n=1 Tax=Kluyveromyces lactis (strain ATCC 8585 / CBS 2359 / DSM 70799 / NBRC 1267 / NRRL Y-1140 / WM37) TaxID=284590 RepID=Q6CKJ3_KLULA|nr:uncharacterized protein KLLA0_F10241g [Kluyveromyces lactis]CAG98254.1 KLLA0F10241p [Kluyveromyces lactis]|eukprot:XP_455546.1 uncharacterized protein KLLA0_F10241g [Kluyveromyces lactis]